MKTKTLISVAGVTVASLAAVLSGCSSSGSGSASEANAKIESDLRNAATMQEFVNLEDGSYASSVSDLQKEARGAATRDNNFEYSPAEFYAGGIQSIVINSTGDSYCMEATSATGTTYNYKSTGGLTEGSCP